MTDSMGPFDPGLPGETKEILVILDLDGDDTTPVVTNIQGQCDVVQAGHGSIRWTPVWSERALKRFHDKVRSDGTNGWLPFARVLGFAASADPWFEQLTADRIVFPPQIVRQEEPQPECSLSMGLAPSVVIDEASDVGYAIILKWRTPVTEEVGEVPWSGTLRFAPRPAGQTDEVPSPTGAHEVPPPPGATQDGTTLRVPIVLQTDDEGQTTHVWNACTEVDEAGSAVTHVTWTPLRFEADVLAYSRANRGTLLETTLDRVKFASDADADRAFDRDSARVDQEGAVTVDIRPDATIPGDGLALSYTLIADEREIDQVSEWDPTIKIKPRTPPAPPSSG